jgi:ubiquinone/menaquinone biosynthesis C-methylase UbiE
MTEIISTTDHYDRLIDVNNDPFNDPPELKKHMEQWTGRLFWNMVGHFENSNIFEIGVGTGRMAYSFLQRGYKSFTGIDISSKTISRAKSNLSTFQNVNLVQSNICNYNSIQKYDLTYSVLTFMHIKDKKTAFHNIFNILNTKGKFVCSFSKQEKWLDFGKWKVELYPFDENKDIHILETAGFNIKNVEKIYDKDKEISVIVCAEK